MCCECPCCDCTCDDCDDTGDRSWGSPMWNTNNPHALALAGETPAEKVVRLRQALEFEESR
jgi:hypothetical protein